MMEPTDPTAHSAEGQSPASAQGTMETAPTGVDAHAHKIIWWDDDVIVTVQNILGFHLLKPRVQGDINIEEFMTRSRAIHETNMDDYFRDPLQIFKSADSVDSETPEVERRLSKRRRIAQAVRYVVLWLVLALAAVFALFAYTALVYRVGWILVPALIVAGTAAIIFLFIGLRVRHFINDGLWPGLMEDRLKAITKRRFRKADPKFRNLINQFVVTFIDNNWTYVKWKRWFQLIAIGLFVVAAAPMLFALPSERLFMLSSVAIWVNAAWFVVWSSIAYMLFEQLTEYVYHKEYMVTLKDSSHDTSTTIVNRMKFLEKLFDKYYLNIQNIQQTGEEQEGVVGQDDVNDESLRGGNGYFSTRMLIWLAKRLEYMELHLMHCMQTAQTVQAVQTEAGFVITWSLFVIGWAAALVLIVHAIVVAGTALTAQAASGSTDWLTLGAQVGVALVMLVEIAFVSLRSYSREGWNSGPDILRQYFSSDRVPGWNTFLSLKFDVKLAGRSQRAMTKIKELYDKVGINSGPSSPRGRG